MMATEQTMEQPYETIKGLSDTELSDLKRCEQIITGGFDTFVQVGKALLEIRDRRLYREQHPTFEEYLSDRWGMSRSRCYQLIQAATITSSLSTMVDKPQNERQVRALAKVPVDQRDQAWAQASKVAAAEQRPVTAKDVQETILGGSGRQTVNETKRLSGGAEQIEVRMSNGTQYARMAILQLEKIDCQDKERQAAFDMVITWIREHR